METCDKNIFHKTYQNRIAEFTVRIDNEMIINAKKGGSKNDL